MAANTYQLKLSPNPRKLLFATAAATVLSCHSGHPKKTTYVHAHPVPDTGVVDTSVHFLANCSVLLQTASEGTIQQIEGGTGGDSASRLDYVECFNCKETFQAYFVLKGGFAYRKSVADSTQERLFNNGCADLFSSFDCFAFVLPMKDPGYFDDDPFKFPETVKVYRRLKDDEWIFMKKVHVATFPKYSRLIFNTIYGY